MTKRDLRHSDSWAGGIALASFASRFAGPSQTASTARIASGIRPLVTASRMRRRSQACGKVRSPDLLEWRGRHRGLVMAKNDRQQARSAFPGDSPTGFGEYEEDRKFCPQWG